jgi:Ca2+:H+ antiporter
MGGLTRRQTVFLAGVIVLTAATGVMHYGAVSPTATFIVAGAALAGLAWVVAFATEQVGARFGPAITGFLQSTLGNLPEFFVVIFALSKGQVIVAQFSILGSIFANALLVLGAVIAVGARVAPDGVMRFRTRLPLDTATLMLLASFIIVLVGLSAASHDNASRHITTISAIASVLILLVYTNWLQDYLRAERHEAAHEAPTHGSSASLRPALVLLALGGVGAAFVSDWFVAALQPAIKQIGVSQEFAGLVLVAIAGNAVENVAGLVLARKGQSDLAISVVKNSVAQVAAFLFPALVLISLAFTHHLTYDMRPVYTGALLLTAISVWQVTGDGVASEFEGWALMATYAMLAVFTLYE